MLKLNKSAWDWQSSKNRCDTFIGTGSAGNTSGLRASISTRSERTRRPRASEPSIRRRFSDSSHYPFHLLPEYFTTNREIQKPAKTWIEEHIKSRECCAFVRTPLNQEATDPLCGCGYPRSSHPPATVEDNDRKWDYRQNTSLIDTNAYGRINFVDEDGNQQPQFVKVAVDFEEEDKMKNIIKLFESRWCLPTPNLLISVTGGAKNFHVAPELLSEFKKGLIKAAKSTNAWVVTGGTSTGVMKLVGEAVRGHSGSNVTTIGIASWGIIKNKECLLRPTSRGKRKMVYDYPTKAEPEQSEAYMDANHSHFLLLDNGTQKQFGVEISMRGALEAAICNHFQDDYDREDCATSSLPMICILVEGGPNSIATSLAAIRNGNPVLVLKGSGRSADVISLCCDLSTSVVTYEGHEESTQRMLADEYKDEVMLEINKHFMFLKIEAREDLFNSLLELIKYDNLLTVYELTGNNDFDNAILISIIRSVTDNRAKMSQMMLAITWDRLQIAEDLILSRHTYDDHELEQLLRVAIIQNKTGFVKKLLDTNADMKHYLTYRELQSLYNTMDLKSQTFAKVLKARAELSHGGVITLQLIGLFLEEVIEGSFRSPWTSPHFNYEAVMDKTIPCPYDVMVLFASIMEFHEMSLLFWNKCKEPIVSGLVAAKINWFLSEFESNKLACDEDNAELLQKQGKEFEQLACGVMGLCYRKFDRKEWTLILTSPRSLVNNMNLIELAKNIGADSFVAESPIQSYLNHTWMGQIHHSTSMKGILFCFIPPFFLLLRYNKRNMTSEEVQAWECRQETKMREKGKIKSIVMAPGLDTDVEDSISLKPAPTKRKVYWREAFVAYYTAPATKFTLHFVTYFLFLAVYGYTLLVPATKKGYILSFSNLTGFDVVLFLWVTGQVPSEWDQLMKQIPMTFTEKLSVHFRDVFNVLDILGIVTYYAAFILKLLAIRSYNVPVQGSMSLYNYYHLTNIIAFVLLALRVIQVLEVSMNLGPKVIMIGKMMVDLCFFLFLMLIFLLTYGIASQALQAPNEEISGYSLYNVILLPLLNIFGEIGLEDMQANLLEGHCPLEDGCGDDFKEFVDSERIVAVHFYVLQVFMFAYLILVNVLLLNLLVAIFTNTYETIEAEASKIWKVQWCAVVTEFRQRQPLPNPFSLIYYVTFAFRWVLTKCQSKHCRQCVQKEKESPDIDFYELHMLVFEAREQYTAKRDADDEAGDVRRNLKFIKDKLIISQMQQTPMPRTASVDRPDVALRSIKHHSIHKDSRKSPYVASDVDRLLVPDRNVPWEVAYPYNPPDYTEMSILKNSDKFSVDPPEPSAAIGQFNKEVDINGDKVDRISFCGTYQLVYGTPLNPRGRTGLKGRGQLNRWGPNHTAEPIVTRWARDNRDDRVMIDGLPVIQFIGIFLKESRKWAIPGGPIRHGEKLTAALRRELGEDALGSIGMKEGEMEHIKAMMQEHLALGIAVYRGYVDDPRNTDNAWIESHAINYHDSLGSSFSRFPLKTSEEGGEVLSVEWITLDRNLDLYGNHEWILEKVCFHRHAFNPFTTSAKKHIPVVS